MSTDTLTQTSEFEICEHPQFGRAHKGKNMKSFMELVQVLLKVPDGKSVRKAFDDVKSATTWEGSLRSFLKRQDINKTYFVGNSKKMDEATGKFYVYIGKRSI